MFNNYWKVALRYLARHKGYTSINVLGLAVGIACCILIMLFVKSEWSFDRFHSKNERIYRAWLEEHYQGEYFRNTVTPVPLVPVLQAGLPEAEMSCRVAGLTPSLKHNNITFNDPVTMVDSNFFRVFDFEVLEGDAKDPFSSPGTLVITQTAAQKYFGSLSPIGKTLEFQLGEDKVVFTITALVKDPPLESSIQFGMLIPFSNAKYIYSEKARTSAWSNVSVSSYFLLKEKAKVEDVNKKIARIMNPLVANSYKPGEYLVRLQPINDIHFNTTLPEELKGDSDPKYSYILGTIGLLILLIACINFVTLSVGRSATRALEVGVRKVLGAERRQLIRQFWGEALLLTLFALVLGLILAYLFVQPFSQIANRELHFSMNGSTILFCLVLLFFIGVIAGMYPAIILSGFKPVQVLKGRVNVGFNAGFFRKALIVGQFVASIIMIICTLTVAKQLEFLQSKNLGFDKEHVIVVPTNKRRVEGMQLAERYMNEIRSNPEVLSATASMYSMAEGGWMTMGYTDVQKVFRRFAFNSVDVDFISAMKLEMVEGRGFQKGNTSDSGAIVVNEALVKEYGWKDPIGQKLPGTYPQQVIGVVKDFHLESLHSPIRSMVMAIKADSIFAHSSDVTYNFSPQPRVSVRFRAGNLQDNVQFLKTSWRSIAGDQDFNYKFLDESLAAAYEQEQRIRVMVQYASFLSIFIACMGLFGLATLVVVRRTKEIGIRKVLGANVGRIVNLLSRDFIIMVLVASLIAFPIAWWALSTWLEDFAYRIKIPWWIFLASTVIALFVALITVSTQAIKAALSNPVKSLRTE